jgi:hypothetical protein
MNKGQYRWLVRLAILPVAGLALYLWLSNREGPGGLTVENRSGGPIARLAITAGGRTSTFHDVLDGSQVTAPVGAQGGPFKLDGEFPDGTRITGRFTVGGQDVVGSGLVVLPGGQIAPRKARR